MTKFRFKTFGSVMDKPDYEVDGVDFSDEIRWSLNGVVTADDAEEAQEKVTDQLSAFSSMFTEWDGMDIQELE